MDTCLVGLMNELMDKWLVEWIDMMNGWMVGWIAGCVDVWDGLIDVRWKFLFVRYCTCNSFNIQSIGPP